jgi:hypothetical protein
MKKENESVDLIASGYEWLCPKCDVVNTEIEVVKEVTCKSCWTTYDVESYQHALE